MSKAKDLPAKRELTGAGLAVNPPGNGGSQPSERSLDVVYQRVRDAILRGDLAPGTIMSQVQVARQLGVSRTPLREALRLLQREGLVDGERNRRVRVAPLSIEDLEQLYVLRLANEALAIRLTVPRLAKGEMDALRRLLADMDRYAKAQDVDGWEVPHREFHRTLVSGAGARPVRMLDELSDHSERYRRVYLDSVPLAWTTGSKEHASIVEACAAGDAEVASDRLARHLSRTALTVLMQIEPEHEPAMLRETLRSLIQTDDSP